MTFTYCNYGVHAILNSMFSLTIELQACFHFYSLHTYFNDCIVFLIDHLLILVPSVDHSRLFSNFC